MGFQMCMKWTNLGSIWSKGSQSGQSGHIGYPEMGPFWGRILDPLTAKCLLGDAGPVSRGFWTPQKGCQSGTLFRTPIWDPSGRPQTACVDPRGRVNNISILYRLDQNIQFRSGPVLGSNSVLFGLRGYLPREGGIRESGISPTLRNPNT